MTQHELNRRHLRTTKITSVASNMQRGTACPGKQLQGTKEREGGVVPKATAVLRKCNGSSVQRG